ncbi:hypothetical protein JCM9279_001695 [Rhodotorula babjevae]
MSGQKRSWPATGTPPSASHKRRKPSTQIVDLTADSDDDDHHQEHRQPAPSSAGRWIHPWSYLLTAGVEVFKTVFAAGQVPALPVKQTPRANGSAPLPSPRQLSSPRVRPDVRLALKRELAQLNHQHAALKEEYVWAKMNARSQGQDAPPKPQEMVDLEKRMKALNVEKKKQRRQQGAVTEDDAASLSAAGASGYQRKKPMGSDKTLKHTSSSSRPPRQLASPPLSAAARPSSPPTRPSAGLPRPLPSAPAPSTSTSSSTRIPRAPWALDYDPDAPRSPSPPSPLSPTPSPPPLATRRLRPAVQQHKRTIAQRDAHTLASLRTQSQAQAQAASSAGSAAWAGAAGDEDELDAPEAEDDLEQQMYGALLESGLQQEQAKHDATSRPTPSRRASRLKVGRSVSGIVKPSALDLAGSTFPSPSPYGLRAPTFPTTSTPPSSSGLAPPLARRRTSGIDHALAMAKASLQEPIDSARSAFDQFDRLKAEIDAANEVSKTLEAAPKPKKRKFPKELPPDDAARVKAILANGRYESSMPGAAASNKDLRRLQGLSWLNDELVNFVGVLINKRSDDADKAEAVGGSRGEGETRLRKAFVFNTNFFTWYGDSGFVKVKRWTRRFDTFEKDIIIVPINHNNSHWCCAAVNIKLKRFEYYDSFGKPAKFVYERLRNWLVEEHRNRKKSEIDLSDWEDYWYEDVPQQQNVSDCGVFTCMFMESLSREVDFFDFTQKNMPYLRNKMVLQIDKLDLLDVEPWV